MNTKLEQSNDHKYLYDINWIGEIKHMQNHLKIGWQRREQSKYLIRITLYQIYMIRVEWVWVMKKSVEEEEEEKDQPMSSPRPAKMGSLCTVYDFYLQLH